VDITLAVGGKDETITLPVMFRCWQAETSSLGQVVEERNAD